MLMNRVHVTMSLRFPDKQKQIGNFQEIVDGGGAEEVGGIAGEISSGGRGIEPVSLNRLTLCYGLLHATCVC